MSLSNSAYDREPKTRAAGSPVTCRICTVKSVENTLKLAGVDPAPIVFDHEADPSATEIFYLQTNKSIEIRRVLNRIDDQVAKRLGEAVRVGVEHTIRNRSQLETARGNQTHPVPQLAHILG